MNVNTLVHDPTILGQLPEGTEIRDADGDAGTKVASGFAVAGWRYPREAGWFTLPVTVVGPPPATARLVADLAGPRNLHGVLESLRSLIDKSDRMFDRQDAAIEALSDEADGDLSSRQTARLERLETRHEREQARMLGDVLDELEALVGPGGGP
ncbi:hypothetical protein ACWC5I_01900 [Kitasatospora sp. NPDC001574]